MSAVLARNEIMLTLHPGEHGSTYGGNPLACRVAIAALKVLRDEKLAENSAKLGPIFREATAALKLKHRWIKDIRGKGLMNAIELSADAPISAWEICLKLKDAGLLAKPTHEHTIRFAPPLVITESQLREGCKILCNVI